MYFGQEYGMNIQSQKGKGTTVEIVIPAILEAPGQEKISTGGTDGAGISDKNTQQEAQV